MALCVLLAALFPLALTSGAAIPAPEQLLPDDTLILLTAPDFNKLRQIRQKSPQSRLWNDAAMKPFRDKFLSRWREEVVKPLERELNVSLDSYARLPQGQLTFAVTKNDWQGSDDQPLGFLLLLDARDQTELLKTNLAELRRAWVAAGKTAPDGEDPQPGVLHLSRHDERSAEDLKQVPLAAAGVPARFPAAPTSSRRRSALPARATCYSTCSRSF